MSRLPWGKLGLFAGGVLFGTAGIKILSSQDAKKVLYECDRSCPSCKGQRHGNRYNRA